MGRGRKTAARTWIVSLAAVAAALPLAFASAATHDPPDLAGYVTDGPVYAVAHEPGGDTYIGGEFSHLGPASGHGLALGAVGSDDEGLPAGTTADDRPLLGDDAFPHVAGGEVHAVVSDEHGGWYIGGDFTSVGGLAIPRLAHIKPDGTVNADWIPNPNNTVLALALDSETYPDDWALYAGGKFTNAGGDTRNFLAAWRVDGPTGAPTSQGLDDDDEVIASKKPLTWRPGQGSGPGGGDVVRALAVTTVEYIVSSGGPPATPEPTASRTPIVFAGGDFIKLGKQSSGNERQKVGAIWGDGARKPTDGTSVDGESIVGWAPPVGTTAAQNVQAIAIGAPEATATDIHIPVYFGGQFPSVNFDATKSNLAASRFTLAKAAGTATNALYPWSPAPNAPVRTLDLEGSTLFVGGSFATIGQPAPPEPVARLAALAAVPAGPTGTVATNTCTPVPCPATAADWRPAPDAPVRAVASSADGSTIYAGGTFSKLGDVAIGPQEGRSGLAAVAGPAAPNAGAALDWDARPAGGSTNALALEGDSLYAGGGFFSVLSEERHNLAALDPDGALIEDFATETGCTGAGCSAEVRSLALAPDAEELYVGGAFTTIGGADRAHLAALDVDPLVDDPDTPDVNEADNPETPEVETDEILGDVVADWAPNPDSWVLTLETTDDRLYAGGAFGGFAPVGGPAAERNRIAALDRETGEVLDWAPDARRVGPGGAEALNVYDIEATCESVYAGGSFNRIGVPDEGTQPSRNSIAELDPETGEATDWDPDANGVVRAIEVTRPPSGDPEDPGGAGITPTGDAGDPPPLTVYAGGQFSVIGDSDVPDGRGVRHGAAALRSEDASVTDWNPDADYTVRALSLSGDEQTVFVGGSFSNIGGEQRSRLAALQADGVGLGNGDATAWDPSPYNPDASAASAVRAVVATGDHVYVGGEQTDVGEYAQRGYAQFTTDTPEEPADEAGCEPPAPAPDEDAPEISAVSSADAGQTLVLTLSEPGDVEIGLTGAGPGLRPLKGPACILDTPANRARLLKQLRKKLGLAKKARARRAGKLGKELAKRRCTLTLPPRNVEADGTQGENRISLAAAGPLPTGFYRAVIEASDEAGNDAVPYSIDFEVSP